MMTKLDAVNIMLRAIQEAPVDTLSSGSPDAADAEQLLDITKDDVLQQGWSFNTEVDLQLTPDVDGNIYVPADALTIDSSGESADITVVPRTDAGLTRLYNRDDQTFTFTDPLYVTVVKTFDFEELPRYFQTYIAIEAAEVFQQNALGAAKLDALLMRRRAIALEQMQSAEADAEDSNILRDSDSVRAVAYRYNRRALR